MKLVLVVCICMILSVSCNPKLDKSDRTFQASKSRDEFVINYLQQAFTYSYQDVEQKQVGLLSHLGNELRSLKKAEFEKLTPKILNGKISQVGELKSLVKLARDAYLGELQIAILEEARVSSFWVQVKVELAAVTKEQAASSAKRENSAEGSESLSPVFEIEKLSVEARKDKTDFPTKLALQESRELALKFPCAIKNIETEGWPQTESLIQSQQQIKLHFGKSADGVLKVNCADKRFSIPIVMGTSFEHVYYRVDNEWIYVDPSQSKGKGATIKSLDTIKHSIEKEMGFSFK